MAKHIFVTGGVASSLGKGLTASSLGRLLKCRGLRVTMQKLDPYINVDPGTMNPFQHGEVFVTDDGGETDLDLGHYERFVDVPLNRNSQRHHRLDLPVGARQGAPGRVPRRDGAGDPAHHRRDQGPHPRASPPTDVDVVITEIGGTVGDIEILPFLEAIRQFRKDVGRDNVFYVHVTLVPFIGPSGEQKTKPTQHSVTELRSRGIQPDAIVCRSDRPIPTRLKEKISQLCDVPEAGIVSAIDARDRSTRSRSCSTTRASTTTSCSRAAPRPSASPTSTEWQQPGRRGCEAADRRCASASSASTSTCPTPTCRSPRRCKHGGYACGAQVEIDWIASDDTEGLLAEGRLRDLDGIVIPGGFGFRGIEGKIAAAGFAREHEVPFLGLCLGLQCAVIEFARDACGLAGANSTRVRPAHARTR